MAHHQRSLAPSTTRQSRRRVGRYGYRDRMAARSAVLTAHLAYPLLRPHTAPHLQVAEATMASDASCTLDRLTALLDSDLRCDRPCRNRPPRA